MLSAFLQPWSVAMQHLAEAPAKGFENSLCLSIRRYLDTSDFQAKFPDKTTYDVRRSVMLLSGTMMLLHVPSTVQCSYIYIYKYIYICTYGPGYKV